MRDKREYFYKAKDVSIDNLVDLAYRNIFRQDFNYPGFIVFDFGHEYSSGQLRTRMVDIKNGLSNRLTMKILTKLHLK